MSLSCFHYSGELRHYSARFSSSPSSSEHLNRTQIARTVSPVLRLSSLFSLSPVSAFHRRFRPFTLSFPSILLFSFAHSFLIPFSLAIMPFFCLLFPDFLIFPFSSPHLSLSPRSLLSPYLSLFSLPHFPLFSFHPFLSVSPFHFVPLHFLLVTPHSPLPFLFRFLSSPLFRSCLASSLLITGRLSSAFTLFFIPFVYLLLVRCLLLLFTCSSLCLLFMNCFREFVRSTLPRLPLGSVGAEPRPGGHGARFYLCFELAFTRADHSARVHLPGRSRGR